MFVNKSVSQMKIYKFGTSSCVIYDIMIVTDDEIRVATIGLHRITEHICKVKKYPAGFSRIEYGSGSSFPYKNEDGTLNERWVELKGDW